MVIPFVCIGGLFFLYMQDIKFHIIVYYIAGGFSFASFVACFIIKPRLQDAREEMMAEQVAKGKGIRYKNMSKEERQKADLMRAMKNESLLSSVEYKNILKQGSKDPEEDLKNLIGLHAVKESVLRYQAQLENKSLDYGSKHMCFLGNPGTGKTTVAGIITGFFYQYKYIKKNEYIAIDGNFLKSSEDPIGRTNLLLQKAKGKVLLIDEAYSLVQGNSGIGQQILATIINEMENNRDKMIIILSGYKKEMRELFQANSGLASRIKNYYIFEDYTIEEMKEIFTSLIHKQNLVVDVDALDKVAEILTRKKQLKNFANARTVRNIAEKSIAEHQYHVVRKHLAEHDRYRLLASDILDEKEMDDYLNYF